MTREVGAMDEQIEKLLAEPGYNDHPLRHALAELHAEFHRMVHQLDRIAHISDRYQSISREKTLTLTARYQKQLRQIEKVARISDRYQMMMRDLHAELREVSTKDPLTGIGNRRLLMERLKSEGARAERMHRPVTVVLADIDHFKTVNDTHGHEVGDLALVEISRAIESSIREYDLCGRWGGEEFMIIMPEVGATEGAVAVERVRAAIAGLGMHAGECALELSASFGIAERRTGEKLSDTLKRADTALFEAKRTGRNRVEVAA